MKNCHNKVETYKSNNQIAMPLLYDDALKYLLERCRRVDSNYGHAKLVALEDIQVFKAANTEDHVETVIINMVIPKGTKLLISRLANRGINYKCRAERAVVHSIKKAAWPHKGCARARSSWQSVFEYGVGKTVRPLKPFDTSMSTCASGIHFFVDVSTALCYSGMAKIKEHHNPSSFECKMGF